MDRKRSKKEEVWRILEKSSLGELEEALRPFPSSGIISYLIGAFLHPDLEVRWKAIHAFGLSLAKLAEINLEKARIVVRRLMWMLNEESGGMAWGVGEAFAEGLYYSLPLKEEYLQIYLSYLWPEGNYLEFPPAQRGFAWGIGRLAQGYEKELYEKGGQEILLFHLESPDPEVVFLSLWSLTQFPSLRQTLATDPRVKKALANLSFFNPEVLLFDGREIRIYQVSDLSFII